MFTSDSSNHGTPLQNGSLGNHVDDADGKPAADDQLEDGAENV